MNTGSVSPFGCCYCQTTFLNFIKAILHSTSKSRPISTEGQESWTQFVYRENWLQKLYLKNIKLQVSQYKLIRQMISYPFKSQEQEVMKLQYLVPLVKQNLRCTSLRSLGKDTDMTIDEEMSIDINNNTYLETPTNWLPSVVETVKRKGKIATWINLISCYQQNISPRHYCMFTVSGM